MQLNRKTFTSVVALTLLAVVSPSVAQSSGAAASAGAGDMTAAIAGLPTCFTACATTAATSSSVGCKGLTDLPCLCAKPAFSNATKTCIGSSGDNDCPKLKTNQTALASANDLFTHLCSAVMGGGASMNGSAMAGMSGMNHGATNASTTGAAGTNTSSKNTTSSTKPNAGHVVTPPAQHILGATAVIMSVLLGGAITLL